MHLDGAASAAEVEVDGAVGGEAVGVGGHVGTPVGSGWAVSCGRSRWCGAGRGRGRRRWVGAAAWTARTIQAFTDRPSRAACSSARSLSDSGSRTVRRAVPRSSLVDGRLGRAAGSSGGGRRHHDLGLAAVDAELHLDVARGGDLGGQRRQGIEEAEPQRRVEGAGQQAGGGLGVLGAGGGGGLEVGADGVDVGGQVHDVTLPPSVTSVKRQCDVTASRQLMPSSFVMPWSRPAV